MSGAKRCQGGKESKTRNFTEKRQPVEAALVSARRIAQTALRSRVALCAERSAAGPTLQVVQD